MSVWEPPTPVPSWRATANGLEGGAAAHNSIMLVADELHQLSPKEAGQAALMLCNGLGKARADQRGEARARKRWTIMVLSSGECSLADRIAAAGETVTAGQEVRFLDLKVDERAFGCFDDLHSEATGGPRRSPNISPTLHARPTARRGRRSSSSSCGRPIL